MPRLEANTIDAADVARFDAQGADWWNLEGAFKPLHRLNPVRVGYIRDQVCLATGRKPGRDCLAGVNWLDVGCGGGILAEPVARLGARVTGIDASSAAIATAKKHAGAQKLVIDYRNMTAEALVASGKQFDVVSALEIVEHVADVPAFVASLAQLVKPGGMLLMSTLNRTAKSFALGIVAAEYILRWVPRGTHQWKQFLRPSELIAQLSEAGLTANDITGLVFNPLTNAFELNKQDLAVNYLLTAVKQ